LLYRGDETQAYTLPQSGLQEQQQQQQPEQGRYHEVHVVLMTYPQKNANNLTATILRLAGIIY
jgi:hypothetical protein